MTCLECLTECSLVITHCVNKFTTPGIQVMEMTQDCRQELVFKTNNLICRPGNIVAVNKTHGRRAW